MALNKTSDLLAHLAYGELSNLKMGNPATGKIRDESVPQVLSALNRAMIEVYTALPLLVRNVTIETHPEVTKYFLRQEFVIGQGGSTEPIRYLSHAFGENFNMGVVRVLDVYDSLGNLISIGDSREYTPVFIPQHDCLQISAVSNNEIYYVTYQSLPVKLTTPYGDLTDVEDSSVSLAPAVRDAVVYLTASKVYSAMNGPAHEMKGAQLYNMYLSKIADSELRDSATTSEYVGSNRFEERGFI